MSKPATTHPLATQEIDGMIDMIQTLIDKGYAIQCEWYRLFPYQKIQGLRKAFPQESG